MATCKGGISREILAGHPSWRHQWLNKWRKSNASTTEPLLMLILLCRR